MEKEKIEPKVGTPIYLKVDIQNLLTEAAKELKSFPVAMGFQMTINYLGTIANRAVETDDPVIIAVLENLGIISDDDDSSRLERQKKLAEYEKAKAKKKTKKTA